MEQQIKIHEPDNTAVRTALWRALHLQIDAPPFIFKDEVGLELIAPNYEWHQRPDMHPEFTKRLRASILARARFIEDLIVDESEKGISQYVILGAGLDTFAQRRAAIAAKLQVYEIDQPDTHLWKQQRLIDLGFGIPEWLHFVSVNFETSSWWDELLKAGFYINKPVVFTCTGVSLYLTKEAITQMLKQISKLCKGSTLAMSFYLPIELIDEEDKPLQLLAEKGAQESGTPFVSFFTPDELLTLVNKIGFSNAKTVSTKDLEQLYFRDRADHLLPASGEIILLATI